jgi:tight adherence protein C
MELVVPLVFVSVSALVMAVGTVFRRRPSQRRLARLANGDVVKIEDRSSETSMLARDKRRWVLRSLSALGGATTKKKSDSAGILKERLIHAGFRRDGAVGVFMGSRVACALLLPVVATMVPAVWGLPETQTALMLCGLAGLGYMLPSSILGRLLARRQKAIDHALPDALDMMVVCVEAGVGINAALSRVSREFAKTHPVLSQELELVTLEIRAGKSMTEALRALADRTGAHDISSLVGLLVQTERFGTSVAQALRVHAEAMRVRRMQRAEEEAGKAPLKMIFPTVIIFLATMIVILTPALIQFAGMFEKS